MEKSELEKRYGAGAVHDTAYIREHYEVIGFMAPFVAVKRKADGVKGSFEFQHDPRFYFNWIEDKK
jgi:hypothetical protein